LLQICVIRLEGFLSCCIHYTRRRLAIYPTPATRHPEASHANHKVFDTVSAKPKDRPRCTVGLSKTAWMSGRPEEQRSRSFASHLGHGKGAEQCSAQGGVILVLKFRAILAI